MSLILMYLLVLILVSAVLFGIASFVFGRGERLPPLPHATTATMLPASGVTGADVDAVKFTQVLRGYRTSEVDWVLDQLGAELDQLRGELHAVRVAAGLADAQDTGGAEYGYLTDGAEYGYRTSYTYEFSETDRTSDA